MLARTTRRMWLRCAVPLHKRPVWMASADARARAAVPWCRALSTERSAVPPPPRDTPPPPPPPPPRRPAHALGPVGWGSLLVLVLGGGALVAHYEKLRSKRLKELEIKSIGPPAIGGPFSLVNHLGEPVTDVDFRDRYMLVYFGFTYCPDICPAELQKMGRVMQTLKQRGRDQLVVPIMITVDPRRDTVQALANYIRDFHPQLIGLTGTPRQIEEVAKLYRVYASTGLTEKEMETTEDYLVDHTIFFYLMGPDGVIRQYFGKQMTAAEVSEGILKVMDADMGVEPSWWRTLFGK